jgi:hypothetical protein
MLGKKRGNVTYHSKVQQRTNLYDNSAYTQKMLDDFNI